MLINLSKVLSEQHETIDKTMELDTTESKLSFGTFQIVRKDLVHLVVGHVEDSKYNVFIDTKITMLLPCDRCLADVNHDFIINTTRHIDLNKSEDEPTEELDGFDESNYVQGYQLDVLQLIDNELTVAWPAKVLCHEDCMGLCNVCGVDLNKNSCECESTDVDLQMSRVRDMFKDFKEV